MHEQIDQGHKGLVKQTAERVALILNRPQDMLQMTSAYLGRNGFSAWQQETVLVELSLKFPLFEKLQLVTPEGNVSVTSNPGQTGILEGEREHLAFVEGLKGERFFSDIYIEENHLPYVMIATPVFRQGKIQNVLIATVNLKGIWTLLDSIRIGKTGYTFLVSSKGSIVAHPNRKLIMGQQDASHAEDIHALATGEIKHIHSLYKRNKKIVMTYADVPAPIPLGVILQMDRKEAYEYLESMWLLSLLTIIFSLGLGIMVSILLSRRLVKPIKELHHWSTRIVAEDYYHTASYEEDDEIGELFDSFDDMSVKLKTAQEKEQLATFGEVVASISHKLKNSIVSLKTFSQVLPQKKGDAEFMDRFETVFTKTIDRLERLFHDLSRISVDSTEKRLPVDLLKLIPSLCQQHETMAQATNVEVVVKKQTEEAVMLGDEEQLRELFSNLIENGIQAMRGGGVLLICIRKDGEPARLHIEISDTGGGIPKEYAQKIFSPFFTTKPDGMGLGLAIAKKITENHGGIISFSNAHGGAGSSFQLLFASCAQKAVARGVS